MQNVLLPVLLFVACVAALSVVLLGLGNICNPGRRGRVKEMPYESGMDPIHDTRRRFDVRFHLVAIAFLLFDVELLFLYPWAVLFRPGVSGSVEPVREAAAGIGGSPAGSEAVDPSRPEYLFLGGMVFLAVLTLGFVYDWRKGVFRWR